MRFAKFCSSDLPYHLVIRQILVIRFAIPSCDSDSTIARHEIRNSCGFRIPDSKTEQYKNSFFVRTVADWNKLEDTVVTVDSVTAFSSAVGRVLQGAASHT